MTAALDRLDQLLNLDYEGIITAAAVEHEAELTDLNRKQLDKGLDAAGNDLGDYRYYEYKNRWRPVDLKDTGAFRRSFDIKPFGKGFEVVATDPKADELQDKYGDAILGLPDTELRTAGEIVLETVIEKIEQQL